MNVNQDQGMGMDGAGWQQLTASSGLAHNYVFPPGLLEANRISEEDSPKPVKLKSPREGEAAGTPRTTPRGKNKAKRAGSKEHI